MYRDVVMENDGDRDIGCCKLKELVYFPVQTSSVGVCKDHIY